MIHFVKINLEVLVWEKGLNNIYFIDCITIHIISQQSNRDHDDKNNTI